MLVILRSMQSILADPHQCVEGGPPRTLSRRIARRVAGWAGACCVRAVHGDFLHCAFTLESPVTLNYPFFTDLCHFSLVRADNRQKKGHSRGRIAFHRLRTHSGAGKGCTYWADRSPSTVDHLDHLDHLLIDRSYSNLPLWVVVQDLYSSADPTQEADL